MAMSMSMCLLCSLKSVRAGYAEHVLYSRLCMYLSQFLLFNVIYFGSFFSFVGRYCFLSFFFLLFFRSCSSHFFLCFSLDDAGQLCVALYPCVVHVTMYAWLLRVLFRIVNVVKNKHNGNTDSARRYEMHNCITVYTMHMCIVQCTPCTNNTVVGVVVVSVFFFLLFSTKKVLKVSGWVISARNYSSKIVLPKVHHCTYIHWDTAHLPTSMYFWMCRHSPETVLCFTEFDCS